MNEKILALLKEHSEKNLHEKWFDDPDFVIDDLAGGNVDDAFWAGSDYGMYCLAEEILGLMREKND